MVSLHTTLLYLDPCSHWSGKQAKLSDCATCAGYIAERAASCVLGLPLQWQQARKERYVNEPCHHDTTRSILLLYFMKSNKITLTLKASTEMTD